VKRGVPGPWVDTGSTCSRTVRHGSFRHGERRQEAVRGAEVEEHPLGDFSSHLPRFEIDHEQRLDALFESWPELKAKALRDITKTECVEWRNRFAAEYSATSFNHTLGILRAIFEIGIEAGARRDNPAKAKEMKRLSETSKRLRLPEPDQFDKFVKEIESSGSGFSKPCAELVQFLAFGGFRINEARYITWADCDLRRGKISVIGEPETGLKGRGAGKTREVPMIPDMRCLLERMRQERPGEQHAGSGKQFAACGGVERHEVTAFGIPAPSAPA